MVDQVMQQQTMPTGNGNVVALGVLQIIYGAVGVLSGLLIAILGGTFMKLMGDAFADFGGESWGTLGAALFVVIGVLVMAFSSIPIISGVGLLKYKNWGRIFTLVLATFAGLEAIFLLVNGAWESAILPGAFSAYAWAILLRANVVALFNQGQTQQQTIVVHTD